MINMMIARNNKDRLLICENKLSKALQTQVNVNTSNCMIYLTFDNTCVVINGKNIVHIKYEGSYSELARICKSIATCIDENSQLFEDTLGGKDVTRSIY